MTDIKSLTVEELTQSLARLALKPYRAQQIFKWLHEKSVESFEEMLNIPKNVRVKLSEIYYISVASIEKKYISCYDDTIKYLYRLHDGAYVEAVLMNYHFGYTLCVSTQAGCKMGCTFCATGQNGFIRNLEPSEMLAQIQAAQKDCHIRISNIVLMGMGEPLDNFDNVLRFIRLVTSDNGLNIGMRHITLSTCGLAHKIRVLADKRLQLTLSVSLHAPNDRMRTQIMPVNKKYPIAVLMEACRYYIHKTGRRISFEYAMIEDFNDTDVCAYELVTLLKGMLCHVNLIPVNTINGASYRKSGPKRQVAFCNILEKNGITATVRRTLGADIGASCGQLKGKSTETSRKNNADKT